MLNFILAICVGFNLGGLVFSKGSKKGFIFALTLCLLGLYIPY